MESIFGAIPSECRSSSGLVGHWKLDESSGNALDSSGNGNTGVLGSSPANPTWLGGNGLSFDGIDDKVTVGSGATTTFDNLQAITIAAWINATTMGEGGKGRIVDKSTGTTPTNGWALLTETNQIRFIVDHQTTDLFRASAVDTIAPGAPYHVAVTWTGSLAATDAKIYINGIETTYATPTNGQGLRVNDGTATLSIGNDSTGARTFHGTLDDVRIYNGVLSASEILALAQAGAPTITTISPLPQGYTTIVYPNQQLAATGGTTPYTWSLAPGSSALPAGLGPITSGGVIGGTPTTAGTSNFAVRVTDAASQFADKPLSITINTNSVPNITTASLPGAGLGVAYNQSVVSTGGDGALLWSVLSGSLPTWAALSNVNSQNATISGTPNALGTSNFTLKLADVHADFDTQALTIVVTDVTPPTGVAVTAPLAGAFVAGTAVTVSGTASDNVAVVGVQFKLDGANLGTEDTTSPYSITWNTTTATNGSHSLTAVARDAAGNTTTSAAVAVTVDNAAPTGVAVTAPAGGATVSGTAVSVTGTALDNVGVVGVQFKLDGANLGAEDTTSPYGITWDTTTASDGSHSLTAVARDAAGNQTTSASITVTVSNVPVPILRYRFNETGTTAASTGSDTTAVTIYNSANVATDLHSADTMGVSMAAGDRSLNFTTATGMGTGFTGPYAKHLADNNNIDTLKSFTVTGWFSASSGTPITGYARLVNNQPAAGGNGFTVLGGPPATTGVLNAGVDGAAASSAASYTNTNFWLFFAVTYDGTQTTNNLKYYVGAKATSVSLVTTITMNKGTVEENSDPLYIGNMAGNNVPFDGYIDNIRVYGHKTNATGVLTLPQLETIRQADNINAP